MKDLRNKVVAITGAGSGIGRALAEQVTAAGALVALADVNEEALRETAARVAGRTRAEVFVVDVSDRGQVESYAREVTSAFGHVDVLINNAGVSSSGRVEELTYETLQWTLGINLWGVIYGSKTFLPLLLARPEASLVNVSSVFGLVGIPGQAAYCASKFAVRGFTEALRQETHGSSLAVTAVFPGGVRTNIARSSRCDTKLSQEVRERQLQQYERIVMTSADAAAATIIAGIRSKAPRVLIGADARRIDILARVAPASYDHVIAWRTARMQREQAATRS